MQLRASSDTLANLQNKMDEYIASGVELGLLIGKKNRTVRVYRPGHNPQILVDPESVDCSPEMPSFILKMGRIW